MNKTKKKKIQAIKKTTKIKKKEKKKKTRNKKMKGGANIELVCLHICKDYFDAINNELKQKCPLLKIQFGKTDYPIRSYRPSSVFGRPSGERLEFTGEEVNFIDIIRERYNNYNVLCLIKEVEVEVDEPVNKRSTFSFFSKSTSKSKSIPNKRKVTKEICVSKLFFNNISGNKISIFSFTLEKFRRKKYNLFLTVVIIRLLSCVKNKLTDKSIQQKNRCNSIISIDDQFATFERFFVLAEIFKLEIYDNLEREILLVTYENGIPKINSNERDEEIVYTSPFVCFLIKYDLVGKKIVFDDKKMNSHYFDCCYEIFNASDVDNSSMEDKIKNNYKKYSVRRENHLFAKYGNIPGLKINQYIDPVRRQTCENKDEEYPFTLFYKLKIDENIGLANQYYDELLTKESKEESKEESKIESEIPNQPNEVKKKRLQCD
jgi:hypothetical protein